MECSTWYELGFQHWIEFARLMLERWVIEDSAIPVFWSDATESVIELIEYIGTYNIRSINL